MRRHLGLIVWLVCTTLLTLGFWFNRYIALAILMAGGSLVVAALWSLVIEGTCWRCGERRPSEDFGLCRDCMKSYTGRRGGS